MCPSVKWEGCRVTLDVSEMKKEGSVWRGHQVKGERQSFEMYDWIGVGMKRNNSLGFIMD